MCIEESDSRKNFNFLNIFYQRIKNHVKIFNSFVFIKTFILVGHGNIVSLFNVLQQKWLNHIPCQNQIEQIFRLKDKNEDFNFCILLSDGAIRFLKNEVNPELGIDTFKPEKSLDNQVEGKITAFDLDKDDN